MHKLNDVMLKIKRCESAKKFSKAQSKAYKVQYGLGFQKYYLFTAYIFTKKQAKYVYRKINTAWF